MNKFTQKFAVLILSLFVMSAPTFAQDAAAPAASPAPAATATDAPVAMDANGNAIPEITHPFYIGAMAGANFYKTANTSNITQFAFGAHAGLDITKIGSFSKLAFGFSFDNTNLNNGGNDAFDKIAYGTTVFQVIFRKVAGTGFYFGPEGGFTIVSLGNSSVDTYTFGGVAGYDWYFCKNLSLAPEVHYDRNGTADLSNLVVVHVPQSNMFKAFLAINYHLE